MSDQPRKGGVMFKVRNKTHPKGPDWRGDVTDDAGKKHAIVGWERESPKGVWLSIQLEEFRERRSDDGRGYGGQRGQDSDGRQPRRDKMDDPMPF